MTTYTFATDAVLATIEAESDDAAAVEFARGEGIPGVEGVAGLLGYLADVGSYGTITDDRGAVVGRVDPNTGRITIFPDGR